MEGKRTPQKKNRLRSRVEERGHTMARTPGHRTEARDPGLTDRTVRLKLAPEPPTTPEGELVDVMEVIASRLATTVWCMKSALVLLVLALCGHVLRLAGVG